MTNITDLSLAELRDALKAKKVSSLEATNAYLANIEKAKDLNAFVAVTADKARAMAKACDARLAKGEGGPIEGAPLGIKDLYCTEGVQTTAGSHILEGFVPTYESSVTANLWRDGGVCLGKLNMDEFAMGSSNETSYYGPVVNPWRKRGGNAQLTPGGSSGGSSASVSARLCAAATATDTGGSIRQPAAVTGIAVFEGYDAVPTAEGVGRAEEIAGGGLDVLVNNAGIQHVAPVDDFPVDRWNAIVAINLSAAFHTTRHALDHMKFNRWGRIVNVASAHALVASPFKSAYVAAKHGIAGFSKSVALEVAECGITVNAVCPGYVLTPLVERQIPDTARARGLSEAQVVRDVLLAAQPTKRFVTTDEVARLVGFLCSDTAASITGTVMPIDGGWTAQ